MSWFPSYTALLVEIEMDKNCRENSSLVSFSNTIAPPFILRKCLINLIICGVSNLLPSSFNPQSVFTVNIVSWRDLEIKKMSFCFYSLMSDPSSDNKRSNSHKNNLRYKEQKEIFSICKLIRAENFLIFLGVEMYSTFFPLPLL